MFFSVRLVSVYHAQESMIGDSGVAAHLAFWLRAHTIVIALIQCGLPDTLFWLSVVLHHFLPCEPSYLENLLNER